MFCVVFTKKKFISLCVVSVIITVLLFNIIAYTRNYVSLDEKQRDIKVIVDAGHGLPDSGTVGINGSVESELNLEIAELIEEILSGKGMEVVMTRTDSNGLKDEDTGKWSKRHDMNKRLKIMKTNNADLFISIHMNHYPEKSVHGLRVFYAKNHPEVKELAELTQNKISAVTGAKMSTVMAADRGLFLMKSPPVPAMLIECGFISNPEEERNLNNKEYKAKLAWSIAEAIEEYFIRDKQSDNQPLVDLKGCFLMF